MTVYQCSLAAILLAGFLAACSNEGTDDPDSGVAPTTCGLSGEATGTECDGIDKCGRFVEVNFCEHCMHRADDHVCEAGMCRKINISLGSLIRTAIRIPEQARGAESFTTASLNPTMANGGKVTCQGLLSADCSFLKNPNLNAVNSKFSGFGAPADPTMSYTASTPAEPGSDRLLFIQVTTGSQGQGTVVARGCTEGITVLENQISDVIIEIN